VNSTFRRTKPTYGPQCDEVFFYHDDSSTTDKDRLSHMMYLFIFGSISLFINVKKYFTNAFVLFG